MVPSVLIKRCTVTLPVTAAPPKSGPMLALPEAPSDVDKSVRLFPVVRVVGDWMVIVPITSSNEVSVRFPVGLLIIMSKKSAPLAERFWPEDPLKVTVPEPALNVAPALIVKLLETETLAEGNVKDALLFTLIMLNANVPEPPTTVLPLKVTVPVAGTKEPLFTVQFVPSMVIIRVPF